MKVIINSKGISMKKNLLAVLLLTMLVGVAHAWQNFAKIPVSGDDLAQQHMVIALYS